MLEKYGVDMVKDIIPPSVTGGGVMMATKAPEFWFQVLGVVIGVLGLILGYYRYKEAKRANNLAEQREKREQEKHDNAKNANPKD